MSYIIIFFIMLLCTVVISIILDGGLKLKYKLINAEQDLFYDHIDDAKNWWTLYFESLILKRKIQRRVRLHYSYKIKDKIGKLVYIKGYNISFINRSK